MPLIILRDDITKMKVDAIVNAANKSLRGGGGVDGAIHKAAGDGLLKECISLNGCDTGKSKITKGYNLPSKHVIHTVGPIWMGGQSGEEELLESCYSTALEIALQNNFESIAFPLISTGVYKFPKEKAFRIATDVIENFLLEHEMTVYIVVYDSKAFGISKELYNDVAQYIDDNYVEKHAIKYMRNRMQEAEYNEEELWALSDDLLASVPQEANPSQFPHPQKSPQEHQPMTSFQMPPPLGTHQLSRSLEDILTNVEDTFSERLLKLIDIKNKSDVEVYKKANIDRKLFSKIRSNTDYKPSKSTVLSFCLALELTLDETEDLLMTAGFALSRSSKFDIIIEYFISNKNYNIFEVNEILFEFDQKILGQ